MVDTNVCKTCGETSHPGHKFCGACGGGLQLKASAGGEVVSYALRSIRDDGSDGELLALTGEETLLGRTDGDFRFPHDATVSPAHAAFRVQDGALLVRDLRSLNGTFVRINPEVALSAGDVFKCGEQYVRFDPLNWLAVADEPSFRGTPRRAWRYQLTQLLESGHAGVVHCALKASTVLGREGCDMNFPTDRFISGVHAQVEQQGQTFQLIDLSSSNGTFIKLKSEIQLVLGDSLFIGRQLLRVDCV